MAFSMEDLSKKAAQFKDKAVEKTSEAAHNTKLAVQIKGLEGKLDDEYKALGKVYFAKLLESECSEEEAKMIKTIQDLIASIKDLKDQKL